MKKEIFAALLLITLITLSLINCAYIDKGIEIICQHTEKAKSFAETGNLEKAKEELQMGRDLFSSHERHAGVLFHHEEIIPIWDIFFEIEEAMSGEDIQSSSVLCDKLIFMLRDMADLQKIKIQNVL